MNSCSLLHMAILESSFKQISRTEENSLKCSCCLLDTHAHVRAHRKCKIKEQKCFLIYLESHIGEFSLSLKSMCGKFLFSVQTFFPPLLCWQLSETRRKVKNEFQNSQTCLLHKKISLKLTVPCVHEPHTLALTFSKCENL